MRKMTLEDLQELGKFLKGARPMTEQEIAVFKIIPEGVTRFQDLKSFQIACKTLYDKRASFEACSNPDEGLFWILERAI